MYTDLRYANIARTAAENVIAAVKYVEEHPTEVEAVLACFGMFDRLTASQIENMCDQTSDAKVRIYTIECMVSTGHLTQIGWCAGYPVYSL